MELQVSNTFAPTTGTISAEDTVTLYGWKALAGSVFLTPELKGKELERAIGVRGVVRNCGRNDCFAQER